MECLHVGWYMLTPPVHANPSAEMKRGPVECVAVFGRIAVRAVHCEASEPYKRHVLCRPICVIE